jgi:hypothetical protein
MIFSPWRRLRHFNCGQIDIDFPSGSLYGSRGLNASSRIYCVGLTRNNVSAHRDDTVRPQTSDRPSGVILEGPLVEDPEDRFATKATSLASAFVAFSSDGDRLATGRFGLAQLLSEGLFHDRSRRTTLRLCVCIQVAWWHRALSGDGCRNGFSCCFVRERASSHISPKSACLTRQSSISPRPLRMR